MGVPAFFKWLSVKYPKIVVDCLEERPTWTDDGARVDVDTSTPNPNGLEFDNLFLDMNGIIHPASHPEDRPPPETEDDMYLAIFDYLERVFAAVRPRKLLYMAIDGVAPRAKMNQKRSRRFRSAQEAQEKEEEEERLRAEWAAEGRAVPPKREGRPFDSNVITPGTPFMDRLAVFLRAFTHKKISSDSGWKGIKVILSDASVPGEGEHKIMEHIRLQRLQPGYDANQRHVIHGLDADLIMLALATHEPHFTILRELVLDRKAAEKRKERQDKGEDLGPMPLQMLQIWTLREYLHREFCDADFSSVPGGYDLERVIDDFVFLCFFVGNDFLPHIPALEIHDGAIDMLMCAYKALMPQLKGYILRAITAQFRRNSAQFSDG